jgi:hypothetical protein
MTEQDNGSGDGASRKPRGDRVVKFAFFIAILVVAIAVYRMQKTDPSMPGWTPDLAIALENASRRNTNVVVAFTHRPMSYDDKELVTRGLLYPRSVKALADLGYLRVHLDDSTGREWMDKYGVGKLPTVLLLGPRGAELRRHEGVMDDLTFKNDFLQVDSFAPAGGK